MKYICTYFAENFYADPQRFSLSIRLETLLLKLEFLLQYCGDVCSPASMIKPREKVAAEEEEEEYRCCADAK